MAASDKEKKKPQKNKEMGEFFNLGKTERNG